ncbi:MAG: malto-oligosyltrehalose trehalohydrolase [Gammaproteobacteria bacterium]
MPFGTEILADGRIRFRLWAPGASEVDVCIGVGASEATVAMAAEPEGWFGLVTELASVGSYYRFQVNGLQVPDPAARSQPTGVHGHSQVIDPQAWLWTDGQWQTPPWEGAVVYELHVGTFTPEGTFGAAVDRLDHLADLGATAIELMPVAEFPGSRNWGYDGVLPFAPARRYGTPEDLKRFVQAAHRRGLMVFLDVVYNHFGPEGNYLHTYAEAFFSQRHHTPWGAAINFDGDDSTWVRQFFIHNALYWLEEFNIDGLRLDAVHAIADDSQPDIVTAIAEAVQRNLRRERRVHLVLENDHNAAHFLARQPNGDARWYTAQWNDDIHHALHVLLTGEQRGYYMDYADAPLRHLGRCLAEGFAYQGEASAYRDHQARGEPSAHLPASAFVSFLQNHDQIGNRAFGERITRLTDGRAVRAATAVLLLAPAPPLLFMGQEWAAASPFPFFCDFGPDLADQVTEGRRREFTRFPEFSDPDALQRIPDPNATTTFKAARLDWSELDQTSHAEWLRFHQRLLQIRRQSIVPLLPVLRCGEAQWSTHAGSGLRVDWPIDPEGCLTLVANLGPEAVDTGEAPAGRVLVAEPDSIPPPGAGVSMPPWSAMWLLAAPGPGT